MTEQNTDNADKGAVFRWCINSDGEDNISLELLSLPASLAAISGRPTFKRDTCPGQKVYGTRLGWECEYTLPIYGPKPILFSPIPKKTIQTLSEDKQKLGRFIKGKREFLQIFPLYILLSQFWKKWEKENTKKRICFFPYSGHHITFKQISNRN
jgi:hypothetical protein